MVTKNLPFSWVFISLCLAGCTPGQLAGWPAQQQETTLFDGPLEKEFAGAYPVNIEPTGTVKTLELVAAPGVWAIFPPYRTPVWTYNNQIPGPVIRIKRGDTLKVKLTNQLPQSTTIHWHGVRVPNEMDGVPGVNQPPVQPGESFSYEFRPKDAGTFWFHPHVNAAEQVERGLHGVLIVEDPDEPVYSRELVMVIDDWKLDKGGNIYPKFVTRHDLAHDGRWGNILTINGRYNPTFIVNPGERIRIRMINVANGRVFSPSIEELSPRVIAVDGMLTGDPIPLRRFALAPGNRIDLDIAIPRRLAGQKLPILNIFSRRVKTMGFLQVSDAPPVDTPKFDAPTAERFPQWLDADGAPLAHEYILNARRGGRYGITWTIDDKAWPRTDNRKFEAGRFIRLRFNNKSPRLHPMHIHGQFFKVIARDGEAVIENFWRDTVLVGSKQSVDIAMIPLDRGVWVTHCHTLEHAEAGMMNTINVQ